MSDYPSKNWKEALDKYERAVMPSGSEKDERMGNPSSDPKTHGGAVTTGAVDLIPTVPAQETVLSSPMAAALLLSLREECEIQHQRANAAEAERDAIRAQLEEAQKRQYPLLKDLTELTRKAGTPR